MGVKALTYGEVLWDIISGREHLGGAPLNVAAHMAKLGCDSSVITRVGADERGEKAKKAIGQIGVGLEYLQTDEKQPTGTAEVVLKGVGVPEFTLIENVAYDYITVDNQLVRQIDGKGYDVLCFGTLVQRSRVSRESLHRLLDEAAFPHVFYDVNIRLDFAPLDLIRKGIRHSTILKLNDGEAELFSGKLFGKALDEMEFVKRITEDNPERIVCITKGGDGCTVHWKGQKTDCTGQAVKVVDTVGSGDAFSAAFLTSYLKDGDPFRAADAGNCLGAYVASHNGAIPEYTDGILQRIGLI